MRRFAALSFWHSQNASQKRRPRHRPRGVKTSGAMARAMQLREHENVPLSLFPAPLPSGPVSSHRARSQCRSARSTVHRQRRGRKRRRRIQRQRRRERRSGWIGQRQRGEFHRRRNKHKRLEHEQHKWKRCKHLRQRRRIGSRTAEHQRRHCSGNFCRERDFTPPCDHVLLQHAQHRDEHGHGRHV